MLHILIITLFVQDKLSLNFWVTGLLLLCVGLTLHQVSSPTGDPLGLLYTLSLAGVASGCTVLAWLRPQRAGLSPPHVMLSLGFGGMLCGLAFDLYLTPLAVLESLCISSRTLSLAESLQFHVSLMPGMHVGMLMGGMAAIPSLRWLRPECRRLCSMLTQNMLCSTWMLLGMTLGAVVFLQVLQSAGRMTLNTMLGGMFTGMVWGMVLSVFLYRSYFHWQDRLKLGVRFGSRP